MIKQKMRQLYIRLLYRRFQFDKWHLDCVNQENEDCNYHQDIVNYVNKLINREKVKNGIIEIGCGLGTIIGNIDFPFYLKKGYDIDGNVVHAAKLANPRALYRVGGFESIGAKPIDVLITINFIHSLPPDYLAEQYREICKRCGVKYIIFDIVRSKEYDYSHTAKEIIPQNYSEICTFHSYNAAKGRRFILVYGENGQL